jgi:hypothetical protein
MPRRRAGTPELRLSRPDRFPCVDHRGGRRRLVEQRQPRCCVGIVVANESPLVAPEQQTEAGSKIELSSLTSRSCKEGEIARMQSDGRRYKWLESALSQRLAMQYACAQNAAIELVRITERAGWNLAGGPIDQFDETRPEPLPNVDIHSGHRDPRRWSGLRGHPARRAEYRYKRTRGREG